MLNFAIPGNFMLNFAIPGNFMLNFAIPGNFMLNFAIPGKGDISSFCCFFYFKKNQKKYPLYYQNFIFISRPVLRLSFCLHTGLRLAKTMFVYLSSRLMLM